MEINPEVSGELGAGVRGGLAVLTHLSLPHCLPDAEQSESPPRPGRSLSLRPLRSWTAVAAAAGLRGAAPAVGRRWRRRVVLCHGAAAGGVRGVASGPSTRSLRSAGAVPPRGEPWLALRGRAGFRRGGAGRRAQPGLRPAAPLSSHRAGRCPALVGGLYSAQLLLEQNPLSAAGLHLLSAGARSDLPASAGGGGCGSAGLQWSDVVCLAMVSSQLQREKNKE